MTWVRRKMNGEIVGQERHPLDCDCTIRDMLRQSSFLRTFLTTDSGWNDAAETKWVDASRLKRAGHSMPPVHPELRNAHDGARSLATNREVSLLHVFRVLHKFRPGVTGQNGGCQ